MFTSIPKASERDYCFTQQQIHELIATEERSLYEISCRRFSLIPSEEGGCPRSRVMNHQQGPET
jgi:hypothetical protein